MIGRQLAWSTSKVHAELEHEFKYMSKNTLFERNLLNTILSNNVFKKVSS